MKELNLTDDRATGIPTIQQKLQENASQRATIETDEERTFFLIDIPCNPYCFGVPEMEDAKNEVAINVARKKGTLFERLNYRM